MFSLQPGDELVFGTTPTTSRGNPIDDPDLILDNSVMEGNLISFSTSTKIGSQLGQKTNFGFPKRRKESRHECGNKKAMHRHTERKRRREMSNLFVSLSSLLSPDHIKGKTSMNDKVQEAVNHIKQMQTRIQELKFQRDKLKKLSDLSGTGSDDLANLVAVNLVPDGLEILISHSVKSSDIWLSRVLAELVERLLDVVSCVSTRAKGRFLHKIQVEAKGVTSLDVSVLQNRLTNAIK